MQHDIVSFQIASLAAQHCFNEKTFYQYDQTTQECYFNSYFASEHGDVNENDILHPHFRDDNFILAPTSNQLRTWLKNNYNLEVCVSWDDKQYSYCFEINNKLKIIDGVGGYSDYNKAMEEGFITVFNLIDNG